MKNDTVDLAAYGAPAGCIGYHYLDLLFGTAAPSNGAYQPPQGEARRLAGDAGSVASP